VDAMRSDSFCRPKRYVVVAHLIPVGSYMIPIESHMTRSLDHLSCTTWNFNWHEDC
jgi:hypothetical protein